MQDNQPISSDQTTTAGQTAPKENPHTHTSREALTRRKALLAGALGTGGLMAGMLAPPRPAHAQIGATGSAAFNVKTYGAKGDGVTDDAAAIQKAIAACTAAGGGIVLLPNGTYSVSRTLVINQARGVVLVGVSPFGTNIVPTAALAGRSIVLFQDSNFCGAMDLTIQGNSGAPPLCGIESKVYNPYGNFFNTHLLLIRVHIGSPSLNSLAYGVRWTAANGKDLNNEEAYLERCFIANVSHYALYVGHSNSLLHSLVSCELLGARGAVELHGGSVTAWNCTLGADGPHNYLVDFFPGTYYHTTSLTNCWSESTGGWIRNAAGAVATLLCTACDFEGGGGDGTGATPIHWSSEASFVTFVNCSLGTGQPNCTALFDVNGVGDHRTHAVFLACTMNGLNFAWTDFLTLQNNRLYYAGGLTPKPGAYLLSKGNAGPGVDQVSQGFVLQ